mmetsp:Transcript_112532/g.195309  ORF Transcript_112532/g.195309 Transcript_112532/m.195309 type:complete len:288 (+) Transcript_112532:50-913(+)
MPSEIARFRVSNLGPQVTCEDLQTALERQLGLSSVRVLPGSLRPEGFGGMQEAQFDLPSSDAALLRGPMREARVYIGETLKIRFEELPMSLESMAVSSGSQIVPSTTTTPTALAERQSMMAQFGSLGVPYAARPSGRYSYSRPQSVQPHAAAEPAMVSHMSSAPHWSAASSAAALLQQSRPSTPRGSLRERHWLEPEPREATRKSLEYMPPARPMSTKGFVDYRRPGPASQMSVRSRPLSEARMSVGPEMANGICSNFCGGVEFLAHGAGEDAKMSMRSCSTNCVLL